ncbi:DUF3267 domain-containing protein [Candidatus Micrarchaeota archaeon]|nr:DUF3267 domain-containing protein [Candidatus Micrarchaeota archaeon]
MQENNEHAQEREVENPFEQINASFGLNLNYFFFPGVILHELAHVLGCLLAGVRVGKVVLWSSWGGMVVHGRANSVNSMLISIMPFLVNNAVGVLFYYLSKNEGDALSSLIYLWLGFSFIIYAFPSSHDLRNSRSAVKRFAQNRLKSALQFILLIFAPALWLVQLVLELHRMVFSSALGRIIWAVLLYLIF